MLRKKRNNLVKLVLFFFIALMSFGGGFAIGIVGEIVRQNVVDQHLVSANAHITEGTHQLIITDQFFDNLATSNYKNVEETISNLNNACNRLNSVFNHIEFKLVANSLNDYSIATATDTSDNDIPIYLSKDYIDGAIGVCSYEVNWNGLLTDQKITFRTWDLMNSWGYQLALHELMHAIGFAHQEKDSVMASTSRSAAKDLTEKDIKMIQEYERRFYETN